MRLAVVSLSLRGIGQIRIHTCALLCHCRVVVANSDVSTWLPQSAVGLISEIINNYSSSPNGL